MSKSLSARLSRLEAGSDEPTAGEPSPLVMLLRPGQTATDEAKQRFPSVKLWIPAGRAALDGAPRAGNVVAMLPEHYSESGSGRRH